jgi:hypothetical protein
MKIYLRHRCDKHIPFVSLYHHHQPIVLIAGAHAFLMKYTTGEWAMRMVGHTGYIFMYN